MLFSFIHCACLHTYDERPALVAQGVSTRRTGHILEALLPQGELRE